MKRAYRYSRAAVASAYARSAVGLAFTLGPLAALEPAPSLSAVLVVGAALFLVYLAKSIAMHTTEIVVDARGMTRRLPTPGHTIDARAVFDLASVSKVMATGAVAMALASALAVAAVLTDPR